MKKYLMLLVGLGSLGCAKDDGPKPVYPVVKEEVPQNITVKDGTYTILDDEHQIHTMWINKHHYIVIENTSYGTHIVKTLVHDPDCPVEHH